MGCCFSCGNSESVLHTVLKLPNGERGMVYQDGSFHPLSSIQTWIRNLYAGSSWTGWVAYNDETTVVHHSTKGHCKGLVTWNDTHIGWLIHSVPHFPTAFSGTMISPILDSELIYGQSFVYLEVTRTTGRLERILQQLEWMEANMFFKHHLPYFTSVKNKMDNQIHVLELSDSINHHAKAPHHCIDIYSEHLVYQDPTDWYIETWRRGSVFSVTSSSLHDVNRLCFDKKEYKETQDHSKWAVSANHVWIGDLNRMVSQCKRGGGGILIRHSGMVKAFHSLIIS